MTLCIFHPLILNSETPTVLFSKTLVIRNRYIQKLLSANLISNTLIICPSVKVSSKFAYSFRECAEIYTVAAKTNDCIQTVASIPRIQCALSFVLKVVFIYYCHPRINTLTFLPTILIKFSCKLFLAVPF